MHARIFKETCWQICRRMIPGFLARYIILIFNLRWYEVLYVSYQQKRLNEKLLALHSFYRLA
jgi:hypothetical protein